MCRLLSAVNAQQYGVWSRPFGGAGRLKRRVAGPNRIAGPEEFALKVAKPGKYRVEANFFGHRQQVLTSGTGLMLWLSSGFGTAAQKDQRTTLRIRSERSERVVVGEFEVKAGAGDSWAGARIEPLR